ncbi:ABC transporter permease [Christensenellaceae bacterium OttesenSCG-928-K19]|nr:ABC transporter permease [Christensenellaceae bacterium OttesenSCG-928-K19]
MDATQSMTAKLSDRQYRANKSRNKTTIIAIILVTVMFTTVFTIGLSLMDTKAQLGAVTTDMSSMFLFISGIILILISGYLIIHNIFQISVTQDIQFYGLLKTLGAKNTQIGSILMRQAARLCLVGIPIGLGIGYGIGALLLPVLLAANSAIAVLSVNPAIFIGAAIFALVTVLISCAKPARMAGKVSPIAALRYIDGEMDDKRKTKRSKRATSISRMAKENLGRNKKRTVTMVASLALGLMLLNSFYVMQNSYDAEAYLKSYCASDIAFSDKSVTVDLLDYSNTNNTVTPELMEQIAAVPGTQTGVAYYTEAQADPGDTAINNIENFYNDEESGPGSWLSSIEAARTSYNKLMQTGRVTAGVYGLDDIAAKTGNVYMGKYDAEKFATGKYAFGLGIADNGADSIFYEIGDKIEIEGKMYEIMGMMELPTSVQGSLETEATALGEKYAIPTAAFLEQFPNTPIMRGFANVEGEENKRAAEQIVLSHMEQDGNLTMQTRDTYASQFREQVAAQVILGYALGVIMALIGVLNFVNTMLTAIIARKREFAMMESVGMTKPQLKQMLVFEGIDYAVITLVISLLLSLFVGLTVIQDSVSMSWVANFQFSLLPLGILAPVLIVLAVFIPLKCFGQTQQRSLVERLRETG